MACYKCGQIMDCIIDDKNMVLHQNHGLEKWEKQEIVRVLKDDNKFCKNGKTDGAKQQNCAGAKFAFKSDHCHIPEPIIGESNKCPIQGKNALSNWAEYEIELSTHGHTQFGKACCHGMDNYHLVPDYTLVTPFPEKCDTTESCEGKCTICDDGYTSGELVAAGKLVQDEGQCAHADMPPLTDPATCQYYPTFQPEGYVIPAPTPPSSPSDPSDPSDPAEPSDPDDGEPSLSLLSEPAECLEDSYISGTAGEVCPNAVEPVIKIERDNDGGLGFDPYDFIYEIEFDTAAKTVTFKVENPLAGDADIYVSYSKPAAILNDEPDCVSSIDQPRCFPTAEPITAYCDQMDGKEALVNLYIASSDTFLFDVGQVATVKQCCYPPENKYDDTFSIIEYAVTIKCDCPETSAVRKLLRGHW